MTRGDDRPRESLFARNAKKQVFYLDFCCKTFLCMRKLEDGNIFKPYAIIDEHTFNAGIGELRK